jgi:hypothetical protein
VYGVKYLGELDQVGRRLDCQDELLQAPLRPLAEVLLLPCGREWKGGELVRKYVSMV